MMYPYPKTYTETLDNCFHAMTSLDISAQEANDFCNKLDKIFDGQSISSCFGKRIGAGSFKEVYQLGNTCVIKFCAGENDTENESCLLNEAIDRGFEDLFVPSYFIPLPSENFVNLEYFTFDDEIEEDGKVVYLEHRTYAETIIIQPLVESLPAQTSVKSGRLFDPVSGKEITPSSVFYFLEWTQDIINLYGASYFRDFMKFTNEFHIRDLHEENIGYYQGKPIIFDWLSDQ